MDIVTLAAARKGGGSGGDVTKQYVDEHLALKADKSETQQYPIASTTTGINPSITDSANANVQELTVYGRSRVIKNLFTTEGATEGAYLSDNGNQAQNSDWAITDFIEISGDYITYSVITNQPGNAPAICFYDDNKGYISGTNYGSRTTLTLTIPNAAKYVRASYFVKDTSWIDTMRLVLASYPASDGIISIGDSGELDVQTCGKNLFDKNATDINNGYISGSYISSDGVVTEYSGYDVSEYIPVYPSTTYTLSSIEGNAPGICSYDENKNYISGIWYNNNTIVQYTTPNNAKYIRFSIKTTKINDIQLELSPTATAYEPYVSTTAILTTGLPLCGIPVTADEIYTDGDGVKWLADTASVDGVVNRCYTLELDGSENWITEGSSADIDNSKRCYFIIDNQYRAANATATTVVNGICSGAVIYNPTQTWNHTTGLSFNTNHVELRIANISTAADLKTYLASNPVTVVYELATPQTIPLTSAEKSALLNLKTFDSTTNVTVTDDPTVDIGYLLDTANGQAVANAIDNAITGVLNTSY